MKNRIVYPEDHEFYRNEPELDWMNMASSPNGNYVVVIDIATGIVYTGNTMGGSFQLGRDVKAFVTRKRKSK